MNDLIIHIGLRKTGTTFLQRHVFPKFNVEFLSRDIGNDFCDEVFSRKPDLGKLFSAFPRSKHATYLVSKESMSLPSTNETILESVVLDRHNGALEDYPIIKRLPEIKRSWRYVYGGRVRILLGIRDPVCLLPSEYAQQSRFITNPCTADFERRVRLYIEQGNDYTNYEKWTELLFELVGKPNMLMIPTETLNRTDIFLRIADFIESGSCHSQIESDVPQKTNSRRKNKDEWGLRVLSADRIIKEVVSKRYRKNRIYRALRLAMRKTFDRDRLDSIILSQQTRNMIIDYHKNIAKKEQGKNRSMK